MLSRRQMLKIGAAGAGVLFAPGAHATLMRGLTLPALARQSERILVATPLGASSHYEVIGGSRRIVTDVTIAVEDVLAKAAPAVDTLTVRVLGGVVGNSGELVHGQAALEPGARCVLFLRETAEGPLWVAGMAQGHYPLLADPAGVARLSPSPKLPKLVNLASSAVLTLSGRSVSEASALVREALAP